MFDYEVLTNDHRDGFFPEVAVGENQRDKKTEN